MNISLLDIFSVKLESPHLFKGTIRMIFFSFTFSTTTKSVMDYSLLLKSNSSLNSTFIYKQWTVYKAWQTLKMLSYQFLWNDPDNVGDDALLQNSQYLHSSDFLWYVGQEGIHYTGFHHSLPLGLQTQIYQFHTTFLKLQCHS